MNARSLLPIAAMALLGAAAPAFAWTGTSRISDYRFTATITPAAAPGFQSLSLSVAPTAASAAQATRLSAWFIDSEGMILAPATIDGSTRDGARLIAYDRSIKVPAGASALVVLAQPGGGGASAGGKAPAVLSQFTLPAGIAPAGA